ELAKKYFPSNAQGYKSIGLAIADRLGNKGADESVWLLMTAMSVDGTKNKNYSKQQDIVAELAETTRVPYEIPTTLEALTCILAEYFRSGKRLFSNGPLAFTHCQNNIEGSRVVVGNFAPDGLHI